MNKQRTSRDLYQETTNKIISLLEQGVTPWRCTWNRYGLARNYASGHIYSGINMILMNCNHHTIPYYMSFKQAKDHGGKVRKGAKSETVLYFQIYFKDEYHKHINKEKAHALQQADKTVHVIPFLKYYNVFNVEDIEGIEFDIPDLSIHPNEQIEKCEAVIAGMSHKPTFQHKNESSAFYRSHDDVLNMPKIGQFESSEEYYATLFHELIHSTGHISRLARPDIVNPKPFGSAAYSKEELIAEIGASFLLAHVGIDYDAIVENSAAYIKGWLNVLKQDKKFIFKSAAQAQKAVDYILGKNA